MAMMGTGTARGEDRARKAAEQAISSPLLEDIDLSDARGILVNMTAGLDMTIGEFEEMGKVIEEFASDSATVVIGSVIDPELHDEVKVTVIATGVTQTAASKAAQARTQENTKVTPLKDKRPQPVNPVVEALEKPAEKVADYATLETSPRLRQHRKPVIAEKTLHTEIKESNADILDIPAFLRRQAD